MPTTPKVSLITIAEMLTDGKICPHHIDAVIDCTIDNEQLSGPVSGRIAKLLYDSGMFRIGVMSELRVAEDRNELGTTASVERSMVIGVIIGMMLVFGVTEIVEVETAVM